MLRLRCAPRRVLFIQTRLHFQFLNQFKSIRHLSYEYNTRAPSSLKASLKMGHEDQFFEPRFGIRNHTAIERRILRHIKAHPHYNELKDSEIDTSKTFSQLGFDSLDRTEILVEIEREFELELDEEYYSNEVAIDEIVKYLQWHPTAK